MSMRLAATTGLLAGVLAGCAFDPGGVGGAGGDPDARGPSPDGITPGDDDAPLPSTRFRKPITIAAGTVGGPLADFPLHVEMANADLAGHVGPGAADLHFVAADGTTVLDHELRAWDADTGHLEAWLRVPAIADDADTTIYVQYGAFASPPGEDRAGVWQNGFVAVWHLDDAPGGPGDIVDARGAVAATSHNMNAGSSVDAVLGNGLAFDGNNDELTFANPLNGSSTHTISAWIEQSTVAHNSMLIALGNGVCGQSRWLHSRFTGGPAAAGFYCDDFTDTKVDLEGDGWVLVHWTYSSADQSVIFVDGEVAAGPFQHAGTQSTQGTGGFIGNAPAAFGDPMGLLGTLDEVRIANVARNRAWVAAEYASQREGATFFTVGPEEPLP